MYVHSYWVLLFLFFWYSVVLIFLYFLQVCCGCSWSRLFIHLKKWTSRPVEQALTEWDPIVGTWKQNWQAWSSLQTRFYRSNVSGVILAARLLIWRPLKAVSMYPNLKAIWNFEYFGRLLIMVCLGAMLKAEITIGGILVFYFIRLQSHPKLVPNI